MSNPDLEQDCKKALIDAFYTVLDWVQAYNAKESEVVLKNLAQTFRNDVDSAAEVCEFIPPKTTYQVTEEHVKRAEAINKAFGEWKTTEDYKAWKEAQEQERLRYAAEFKEAFERQKAEATKRGMEK